ncbi:MAG: glycosyltransferase [Firmicutes bacterium HGW-Firmicutes-8]|nr:MAG: glycosyltransferase [Firmicutes bacterium HGW-Firmicutes-8]
MRFMDKISILGVEIDNLSLEEVLGAVDRYLKKGDPSLIVTANPEIIMLAREDASFRACLDEAQTVVADGIGIIIASRLLGTPLKQRVAGIDLVTALFEQAAKKKYRFYFVGAKPGVAERAAANIKDSYPGIEIVGIQHGYFQEDAAIIEDIAQKKPDILLVALGMGKQEKWIKKRIQKIGVPVSIGVGGSFDVFAGEARRAPVWMQKAGLEWLYRLLKQPSRIGRMMKLPVFLLAVLASKKKN